MHGTTTSAVAHLSFCYVGWFLDVELWDSKLPSTSHTDDDSWRWKRRSVMRETWVKHQRRNLRWFRRGRSRCRLHHWAAGEKDLGGRARCQFSVEDRIRLLSESTLLMSLCVEYRLSVSDNNSPHQPSPAMSGLSTDWRSRTPDDHLRRGGLWTRIHDAPKTTKVKV